LWSFRETEAIIADRPHLPQRKGNTLMTKQAITITTQHLDDAHTMRLHNILRLVAGFDGDADIETTVAGTELDRDMDRLVRGAAPLE
jgi:hypothetical protein